ncbi:MAG: hypothetical protein DDG59_09150 [Anaerolineae bacterium]|jgi:hypothetical protein|nr:MAG: hypothetical protein DDG59_09150 [Anaerolineae bacterium]
MRIIRASEINAFLYCHRAWWYGLQGLPSDNQADLAEGSWSHQVQARRLWRAIWAVRLAVLAFVLAVLLLIWHFIA